MSTSKLDLEVSRGTGFSDNKFAFKFSIKNYDTGSIPLSALRVVSYGWLQNIVPNSAFTSGVTSAGSIETISTSSVHMPGNGTGGIVYLNTADIVYTVNHLEIDPNVVSPQISLNVPYGSSSIGPIAVIDRTATSFKLSLPDVVPTAGYQIAWFLPDIVETYTNPISVSSPVASIELLTSASIVNPLKRANSRFIVGWNTNDTLNPSKGLLGVDLYFQPLTTFFPSNRISEWYSYPNNSLITDDPYFVLEQLVDNEWTTVLEYNSSTTIDDSTGTLPSTTNTTYLKQTVLSGSNIFAYIGENEDNPFRQEIESNLSLASTTTGLYNVDSGAETIVRLSGCYSLSTANYPDEDHDYDSEAYSKIVNSNGNYYLFSNSESNTYPINFAKYSKWAKVRIATSATNSSYGVRSHISFSDTGNSYFLTHNGYYFTSLNFINGGGSWSFANFSDFSSIVKITESSAIVFYKNRKIDNFDDSQSSVYDKFTTISGSTSRAWTGAIKASDGIIYACVSGGKIFIVNTDGSDNEISTTTTTTWQGILEHNNKIYAYSETDIYLFDQTLGTTTLISPTTTRYYSPSSATETFYDGVSYGDYIYFTRYNSVVSHTYMFVFNPDTSTIEEIGIYNSSNTAHPYYLLKYNDVLYYSANNSYLTTILNIENVFSIVGNFVNSPTGTFRSVSNISGTNYFAVCDMTSSEYALFMTIDLNGVYGNSVNVVYGTSDNSYNCGAYIDGTYYIWESVGGSKLATLDISTGTVTELSNTLSRTWVGIIKANSGIKYAYSSSGFYEFDSTTGIMTQKTSPNEIVYIKSVYLNTNGKIIAITQFGWYEYDETLDTWSEITYTDTSYKSLLWLDAFDYTTVTTTTDTSMVVSGSPYVDMSLRSGSEKRRSLIKFDSEKLPSSAKRIKNAVLRLGVDSLSNEQYYPNGNVSVHKILEDWNKSYVTWTKRTSTTNWSDAGGTFSSTSANWIGNSTITNDFDSSDNASRFIMDFDVTNFVEEWLDDPTSNKGFLIKLSPTVHEELLSTVEYQIQTARSALTDYVPELIINYATDDVGNTPYVEIVNPKEETTVYSSITLRATAEVYESTIEKVEYYYSSTTEFDQSTLLGEATFTGTNYVYTATTDELDGDYYIFAKAQSVLGAEGTSLPVLIHFEKVTPVTVSTNGVICHNGSLTIDGTYETLNGNNPTLIIVQYKYKQLNDASSIFRFITEPDNPNVIWCSTMGSGIIRINTSAVEEDAVTFYNKTNNGLYSDYTTGISLDSDGWLWFGSRQTAADQSGVYGITKLNTNAWDSLSDDDIVKYDLTSISNKDVWDIDIYGTKKIFTFTFGTTMSSTASDLSDISSVYSSITQPRSSKIFSDGSIVIGTQSNKLYHINGSDIKTFTTPLSNIRSVEKDSNGYVWAATTNGAFKLDLSTSAITVFNKSNGSSSATYPYGLNKNSDGVGNNEYMSVVVSAPNGDVVFGMPEFGSYHGGIARYNGTSWYIYDTDNTPGLPSNNIGNTIEFDSNNRLWASTSKGLAYYDGSWHNLATEEISLSATINSDGTWSVDWTNPTFKNPHQLKVVYTYPDLTDKVYFDVTPSRIPEISATYSNPVVGIIHDTTQKIANVKITCDDIMYGGSVSYSVEKSSDNVSWNIIKTESYKGVFDYSTSALQFEKSYYRFSAENQSGCSALSNSVLVYGNTAPTGTLSATSEIYNSKTDLEVFGECYDVDSGTFLSNDGYSIVEGVSAIHLYGKTSASDSYIGVGTIDNNSWSYTWDNPVVGTSAIKAVIYDYLGATKEYIYTLDSIIKGVGSIKLIAPTNIDGYYKHTSATTFIASAVDPEYTISSIEFWSIPKFGTSALNVGVGTSIGNNLWTKTTLISSFTSAIDCSGGTYKNFAKMTNSNGDVIFSDIKEIYLNHIPDVVINVPDAIHTGTQTISGSVIHPDGSVSIPVYITSGNTIVKTTTADSAGKFYWTITNPEYGIKNYSVVVNDTETSATGDSRKRNFVLKSSTKPVFHITSHTVNSLNVDTGTIIVSGEIG